MWQFSQKDPNQMYQVSSDRPINYHPVQGHQPLLIDIPSFHIQVQYLKVSFRRLTPRSFPNYRYDPDNDLDDLSIQGS